MKTIIIDQNSDANQRLDKFLKKFFPNAPLGALYKMLRTGKIKVNNKKKEQTYRLELDDEIQIFLTDDEIEHFQKIEEKILPEKKPHPKLQILYQDEDFLVINKPPKMNVHPWDHKSTEASLIEIVHDLLGDKYNSLTFKPSLVHRIDRDTSGCILIALKKSALDNLLSQLQNHNIEKIYHTIVIGKMKSPRGTITEKILRKESAKNEAKVMISDDWQKAITHYRTLEEIKKPEWEFSLLECSIETGRTHQIRVHLSYHNCPILWDSSYGDKKINSYESRNSGIHRQMLHARKLAFNHPLTGKKISIEAPYFTDMKNFLKK